MISFFTENIPAPNINETATSEWLSSVIDAEGGELIELSYIFCDDEYLHQMNVQYLDHDTLTDVITFPYADPPTVHGDIFISLDRIQDNANGLGISFEMELNRVMVHGLLHLLGYGDKSKEEKAVMTGKENEYLELLPS